MTATTTLNPVQSRLLALAEALGVPDGERPWEGLPAAMTVANLRAYRYDSAEQVADMGRAIRELEGRRP